MIGGIIVWDLLHDYSARGRCLSRPSFNNRSSRSRLTSTANFFMAWTSRMTCLFFACRFSFAARVCSFRRLSFAFKPMESKVWLLKQGNWERKFLPFWCRIAASFFSCVVIAAVQFLRKIQHQNNSMIHTNNITKKESYDEEHGLEPSRWGPQHSRRTSESDCPRPPSHRPWVPLETKLRIRR